MFVTLLTPLEEVFLGHFNSFSSDLFQMSVGASIIRDFQTFRKVLYTLKQSKILK